MTEIRDDDQAPWSVVQPVVQAEVVELPPAGQEPRIGRRELDLTETAVRRWVAQADTDAGERPGLTTGERDELVRSRRENRTLCEERDILKRPWLSSRGRSGERVPAPPLDYNGPTSSSLI